MTPKKAKARKVRPRSVEDLIQFLSSFEPDPEYVANVLAIRAERCGSFDGDQREERARRLSTRKS